MGKIVLLVPREEMLHQAHNILQEKVYTINEMKVVTPENTIIEARNAIGKGADILIARGLQASLIKQYIDIPVVEIAATAQEMGLLVTKGKQIVGKQKPVIAAVGFANTFCDMSYFEELYGIELKTFYAENGSHLQETVQEAIQAEVDFIIGGEAAIEAAKEAEIPSLFLSLTEDSLRMAFDLAERMNEAMESERRTVARMETLLDNSFNGVVNISKDGMITTVNPMMEEILGKPASELKGQPMELIFPDMEQGKLKAVLLGELDSYSSFLQINKISIYAVTAPVRVEGETEGAILTCHKMRKNTGAFREKENQQDQRLIAAGQFHQILQQSDRMKECVHLARLYSQSEKPVLILGEVGTEKLLLAQSIHNTGTRSEAAFLALSCSGMSEEMQREVLFGDKGTVIMTNGGTLFLEEIEQLALSNQYALFQLIRYHKNIGRDFVRNAVRNVRIIVSSTLSQMELYQRMEAGIFLPELYYLFHGLILNVPPLRLRKEDLEEQIKELLKQKCEQYERYHILTKGALELLMTEKWEGNFLQLDSFMESLVLTANKRNIDEYAIRKLKENLLQTEDFFKKTYKEIENLEEMIQQKNRNMGQEEEAIRKVLKETGGSRKVTAKRLGMSTTTLWRKIKKYEIECERSICKKSK